MLAFIANCFQTDGVAQSLIPQARGRGTPGVEGGWGGGGRALDRLLACILEENVQDWGVGPWL